MEDENKIIAQAQMEGEDDYSRERYSGYKTQAEYQKDMKDEWDGKICGALTSKKKMCRGKPMENGRCRKHGGKTPKGVDSPNYKHGGYSKYLPDSLMEKYKDAEDDSDLLSLRKEAALVTSRIFELSEKINEGAGKKAIDSLLDTYSRYKKAVDNDLKSKDVLRYELESHLDEIEEDTKIWDEVQSLVNLKRKLVSSEHKRMKTMSQYIPAEKVMLLMTALMDIVTDEIEDLDGVLMDEEMIQKTVETVARRFSNITNNNGNYRHD